VVDFDWRRIAAGTAALYAEARSSGSTGLGRPKIPTGNAFSGERSCSGASAFPEGVAPTAP